MSCGTDAAVAVAIQEPGAVVEDADRLHAAAGPIADDGDVALMAVLEDVIDHVGPELAA